MRPIPGRPSKKIAPLQAYPDATLESYCQLWEQEHGLLVSTTTMGRAIRRVGWTRKKRRLSCLRAQRRGASSLA